MNRFFRHPLTNAVGIGIFSLFYAVIFFAFSDRLQSQTGAATHAFWKAWDNLLDLGFHRYTAYALLSLTAFIVIFLLIKHKPYDEYHTTRLIKCLAISVIFTLFAIAVFFIVVLLDPSAIISKFTLFITVNWATVVFADMIYLLSCSKK